MDTHASPERRLLDASGAVIALWLFLGSPSVAAQQRANGSTDTRSELAREVDNPIAKLIHHSFQYNYEPSLYNSGRTQQNIKFEPAIPVIAGAVMVIPRPVVEFESKPEGTDQRIEGLTDVVLPILFASTATHKLMWAIGPTFIFPTAAEERLGDGKWQVGPTAVLLYQPSHKWSFALFPQQWWSVGGQDDRPDVSSMKLQYIIKYHLPRGWTLKSTPTIDANWKEPGDERWRVPVGLGVGKVFTVGRLPLSTSIQVFYTVVHPETRTAPRWTFRYSLGPLYPQGRRN
jgi:hypothetical protein